MLMLSMEMVCRTKTKETHSRRSEMINTIDEDRSWLMMMMT
jgi:hypothetical protein